MSSRTNLRALRVLTTCALTTALVFSPAAAEAATKKKAASKKTRVALKEAAKNSKPAKVLKVSAPASAATGLGSIVGISATQQLAAMNTAIKAAPDFFAGRTNGCANLTPMIASQPGQIMAGNFRDSGGNCYAWLNLQQSSMLTGSEICKTTLHELGHLTGLQHSADVNDVMFSPFVADPVPAPCRVQAAPAATSDTSAAVQTVTKALRKAKAKSSAVLCPPGTTNLDYCAVTVAAKRTGMMAAQKSISKKRPGAR